MFTTVFDISFGEAFDNSNNALPASLNITSSAASSSGRNPYIIDTHLGFYEKNKAQQLFSLQSSEIITSSDIIDISELSKIEKLSKLSLDSLTLIQEKELVSLSRTLTIESRLSMLGLSNVNHVNCNY